MNNGYFQIALLILAYSPNAVAQNRLPVPTLAEEARHEEVITDLWAWLASLRNHLEAARSRACNSTVIGDIKRTCRDVHSRLQRLPGVRSVRSMQRLDQTIDEFRRDSVVWNGLERWVCATEIREIRNCFNELHVEVERIRDRSMVSRNNGSTLIPLR